MKRIMVLAAIFTMLMFGVSHAARLTCDHTPESVDHVQLKIDGGAAVTSPAVQVTGGYTFYYNLDSLPNGNHTVVGSWCNVWGCGADSAPFTFNKNAPTQTIIYKVVPNQ